MFPRWLMLPLFTALMGAIIGGTIIGTILVPEPPRTHYYDSGNQAANTEHNQARQQSSLWIPQDSTGFFALWTALFTAVLAVSTILLWSETNNASSAAERAANAADLSAKAAIGVELPIITIERLDLWHPPVGPVRGVPAETIKVIIVLKNLGRTFAELIACGVTTQVHENLPEVPVYFSQIPYVPGRFLVEDATVIIPPAGEYIVHLDAEEISCIAAQTKFLWVYGFLSFRDFLGNPHEMRFCAKWEAVNPEGDGNGKGRGFVLDVQTPKAYLQRS